MGTVLLLCLIRVAWISDDTFIIFRTIDNFTQGHGLRWNVAERVQVFTNPLWTALLLLANALTRELFFTTIAVSILLSILTWWLIVTRFAQSTAAAAAVTVLLVSSSAFMDFSTSGLENPLTHVLVVAFVALFLSPRLTRWPLTRLATLVLCAALGMCNRLDTLLLFLPALVHGLLAQLRPSGHDHESTTSSRDEHGVGGSAMERRLDGVEAGLNGRILLALSLGLAPLVIWELFSLFYYGFLFPNTAYAKLGHGIGRVQLLEQGLFYLQDGWLHHKPTLLSIVAASLLALGRPRSRPAMISLGALLYLAYVVWVGGGFMSGRFLTAPFVAILPLLARRKWRPSAAVLLAGILGLALPLPPCLRPGPPEFGKRHEHGIVDERSFYFRYYGLVPVLSDPSTLDRHSNALLAHKLIGELEEIEARPHVLPWNRVGQFGYLVGPDVHIVDTYALADPLLARIPARRNHNWRVGHFRRSVPEGYVETLESGEDEFEDEQLGQYFEKLRLITSGDLVSWARFKEIFRFNLGLHADLIDREKYRMAGMLQVDLRSIEAPVPEGTRRSDERCRSLTPSGIQISIGSRVHNSQIEVSLDHNDDYLIQFLMGDRRRGEALARAHRIASKGVWVHTIDVPASAAQDGYDSILILPQRGDKNSCIGHLRLL